MSEEELVSDSTDPADYATRPWTFWTLGCCSTNRGGKPMPQVYRQIGTPDMHAAAINRLDCLEDLLATQQQFNLMVVGHWTN